MMLSENNFLVSFGVSFIFQGLMITPFMVERPFIFLFVVTLLEFYFLERYIKSNKNNFYYNSTDIVNIIGQPRSSYVA